MLKNLKPKNLWAKIDKKSETECWIWQGTKTTAGYGVLRVNYKLKYAHRLMWILHNKTDIPKRGCICHSCDNPPCCNPAHLFLGSHSDNMKDAKAKGRISHGISHFLTELTEDDIRQIRYLGQTNISHKDIGKRFDITRMSVNDIIHKRTWAHVDPEWKPPEHKSKGITHPFAKLDEDKVREIRQLIKEGNSQQATAKIFDVSRGTVEAIIKNKTWVHVK